MNAFLTSEGLLALLTLTILEIVLGVDNVIFGHRVGLHNGVPEAQKNAPALPLTGAADDL